MKKVISIILASLLAASALVSCATDTLLTPHSSLLTFTSSSTCADLAWLEARLGKVPANVSVGLASDLGIDMTSFEDDGYLIRTEGGETVVAGKTSDGLDRAVRAYAKAYEAGKSVPDAAYHEGYRIDRFTIAGRDISEYTIVYEGGTSPVVGSNGYTFDNSYYAATEFCQLTEKACGVKLPISAKDAEHMIKITYLTDGSHGENGFTYEVKDGNLLIAGAPDALGCGNAVWYFFETECGWEALTYGDAELHEADHVDVPEGTKADVDPMFDYLLPYENCFDSFRFDRRGYNYAGLIAHACHGIDKYCNPNHAYVDGQPCLTDPETCAMITDGVIEDIENRLAAGKIIGKDFLYIDLASEDNLNFCHCKTCMKVLKEENGANSGPIVRYINALNDELDADYPGLKFLMFAYHGCNIPCVTKPCDDIFITYITDGCCFNHYLDGSENCDPTFDFCGVMGNRDFSNKDYAEWMRGWCAMSDNVYIWHYGLDCPFHQYTQDHNLYEDFHFIADCGVRGFMYEGEHYGMGEGRLRLQELMMMQFHPEWTREEYDAAVSELYAREFGDGGEYILAYTKNCWSPAQLAGGCGDCWGYMDLIDPGRFDYDVFHATEDRAMTLLDTAITLANNERQQKAAERFSCDFLYKYCYYNYFRALDAGDTETMAKLEDAYAVFRERMAHNGFVKSFRNFATEVIFQPTLAEEAEVNWTPWRDELTDPETLIPMSDEVEDGKRVYRVKRADSLDGIDWLTVPAAPIDTYKWVDCTQMKSFAQLVYVEDYGFVCRMTCYEKDPAARYTKMDDTVCFDSCMEFFVNFGGKKYLNLEGNSIATVCMQSGSSRSSRTAVNRKLPGGFKTIAEKKSDRWYLTYYLPMEEIQIFVPDVSADTFVSGYAFSGNFYKTAGSQTGNEHYAMWNEVMTDNPDFHRPEYFGTFIME